MYVILSFHFQRYWRTYLVAVGAIALVVLASWLVLRPPTDFPVGQTVIIKNGEALPAISSELASEHIIAHPLLFKLMVRLAGGGGDIKQGPYLFASPMNALSVAKRLLLGESGIPEVRITFIEGSSVRDMSLMVASKFPDISASDFVAAAGGYEGYLFPDTYEFDPAATPDEIVSTMYQNFQTKIASIQPEIASSTYSLSDIVIMASIVQKEANTPADMKIVAGILWNRIAKGIPLQVDAPFGYLQGRDEYAPSLADLSIDSPYNTYEHKGLTPTPIGNPGLQALEAAADPTITSYLYYLSDANGVMHYSATYAGQLANERKYLN